MALGPAVLQPDAPDVRPLFHVGPIAQFTERQIEMEAQPLRIMVDDDLEAVAGLQMLKQLPYDVVPKARLDIRDLDHPFFRPTHAVTGCCAGRLRHPASAGP